MANKTYPQLTAITDPADADLVGIWDTMAGLLKKMAWSAFVAKVAAAIAGTYLTVANNLSDLASAASARANLGLGTAATLASSALFQVANNFSEVANAATARTNIGAAASSAPTITGGMTYTGATKQNVQALAALDVDVTAAEFFTKSISTGSTFTFSGATSAKAQAFVLELTISSAAVPTWPGSVDWGGTTPPVLGNGRHVLGFVTLNGGTDWTGMVGAKAAG